MTPSSMRGCRPLGVFMRARSLAGARESGPELRPFSRVARLILAGDFQGAIMKYLRAFALAVLVCVGTASAEELTGLWKAKGRFGPDVRGPLIIVKEGADYSADMLGRRLPMGVHAGELRFELPAHLGSFRGKIEGRSILGHWFQPSTPVNWSGAKWPVEATPVRLEPDGPNRWRGSVAA